MTSLALLSSRSPEKDWLTRLPACLGVAVWQSAIRDVKESKQITLGSSDSTTTAADFTYSMQGKLISITYLGAGSIHEEVARILRRIEHWHQGPVASYRILYQDAAGLGGEVAWDGENAEVITPR
jgi:hypothetical protein